MTNYFTVEKQCPWLTHCSLDITAHILFRLGFYFIKYCFSLTITVLSKKTTSYTWPYAYT